MGWFSKKETKESIRWGARTDEAARDARDAVRKSAEYRRGTGDPGTDRYMIRQLDADRRVAEANAREFRATADQSRRRRFWR